MKNLFFPLLIIVILVFSSCKKNGPIITKDYTFSTFKRVSLQSDVDANISYGATQSVRLTGSDNLLDKIEMYVDNETLIIKIKFGTIITNNNIVANITIPTVDFLEIKGSADLWVDDFANLEDVQMKISGSGNIKTGVLSLNKTLIATISGSGEIVTQGQAAAANVKISGSGDCNAERLMATTSDIRISGSGNVKVNVATDLNVNISGSGDVHYKGQPSINVNISGSGQLVNAN